MKLIALILISVSTAHADYFETYNRREEAKREAAAAEKRERWIRVREEHNAELYAAVRRFAYKNGGGEPTEVRSHNKQNLFIEDEKFVNTLTFTIASGYQCYATNYGQIEIRCIDPRTGHEFGIGSEVSPLNLKKSKKPASRKPRG